ncbi:MAG: hypothetical protein KBD64_00835 [Gammaproteobacteria bacterium]|nr:hypothetical protein [Gammaproteobacteria bacterium]
MKFKKIFKKVRDNIKDFFSVEPWRTDQQYQARFQHNYFYFKRYESSGIFSRAWWYAFGSAFLYFVPTFGMILEIINLVSHYGHYVAFGFAAATPLLIAVAVCVAVISLVLACLEFKHLLKRCRRVYEKGEELQRCKAQTACLLEELLNAGIDEPQSLNADVCDPIDNPEYVTLNKIKKFLKLTVHSILGSIGWLYTISAFTGVGVFSTVSLVSIPFLGFISPLFLAVIFICINLFVAAWVHGIVEPRFEYNQRQQERYFSECKRREQLIRDVGAKKLSANWADHNITSEMVRDGSYGQKISEKQRGRLLRLWDSMEPREKRVKLKLVELNSFRPCQP